MLKKSKIVMLSTNEKAISKNQIVLNKETNDLYISGKDIYKEDWSKLCTPYLISPQHLYITSDEEIKEGEWKICLNDNAISQYLSNKSIESDTLCKDCKKIIATTDTSLGLSEVGKAGYSVDEFNPTLPQPSQSFIEKYITEYNKGNVITDVLVEYEVNGEEDWSGSDEDGEPVWNEKIELKINPKDNTITIRKVKDSWIKSDEDLIKAFEKFACAVYNEHYKNDMSFRKRAEIMSKKWIEENL